MENTVTDIPCIICKRQIEKVSSNPFQGYDAISFYSHGNYGSTIYDNLTEDKLLIINICDSCIVSNSYFVIEQNNRQKIIESTYRIWNPDE